MEEEEEKKTTEEKKERKKEKKDLEKDRRKLWTWLQVGSSGTSVMHGAD